jgi:hypothetical protein
MQGYLCRTTPHIRGKDNEYSFTELYNIVYSPEITEEDIKKLILFFNMRLDKITLIKIDTKQKYDRFDLEAENKAFGLD